MKKTLLSLLAVGLFATTGYSQGTNTTTVPQFLNDVYDTLIGQGLTNLSLTVYGTYTPSIKEWGGGMVLLRNIPIGHGIGTGIGVGLDYYDEEWYAVSAQVTLNASLRPFEAFGWTNFVATPFTFIGLGTPFGNEDRGTAGNLETIASVGMAFRIVKIGPGYLEAIGTYGTRTGLGDATGTFYGGGVNYTIVF